MKVPLSWLKELVPITVGAQQLADDLARIGLACDGIETDGRDAVLDLDVTTNRVDCMNVQGVAREVAVLYGLPLQPPAIDFPEAGEPEMVSVCTSATVSCTATSETKRSADPSESMSGT